MGIIDFTPDVTLPPKQYKKMIEIKSTGGHVEVKVNASSLAVLQTCMRKSWYLLHRGLVSKQEAPATLFGSAIHKALETYYVASRSERIIPPNMNKNLELMSFGAPVEGESNYLVYRATRQFINHAAPLSNLPAEDKRSIPNGVWILSHYFNTYAKETDPYVVHKIDGEPQVEKYLEAELHRENNLTITLHGTIDVILENEFTKQIIIADHKTSSVVGREFYNRLKPNMQYSIYVYLVQKALGIMTDKFLVNCIEVKPKPKTSRGSPPNFPRQITTRSEDDLVEMKQTLVHFVKSYLECAKSGVWPLGSTDACSMYGACQFIDVCSSPLSIRENILEVNYKKGYN